MFKLFIFLLIAFLNCYGQEPYFIAIYSGNADYKAQIGGGHYELKSVNYNMVRDNIYAVNLEFSKKKNKYLFMSQEELIYIEVITPKHIRLITDINEYYFSFPSSPKDISFQSQKGDIRLNLEIIQNLHSQLININQ